jgi:surface protein
LYSHCCQGCGFKFLSSDSLKRAIKSYEADAASAIEQYGVMNCWDTSAITDMSYLFSSDTYGKTYHKMNEQIHCWSVSKVTTMKAMLEGALAFNQPLNSWDVSSVTDMSLMFYNATKFNQPLDEWSVSKVNDMGEMFSYAGSFNQSLHSWDVSAVDNLFRMFYHATSFQQDLCQWYNLKYQNTPIITEMFVDSGCGNTSDPSFDMKTPFCGTSESPNCPVSFIYFARCSFIIQCSVGMCFLSWLCFFRHYRT